MIRPTEAGDVAAIASLLDALGLFRAEEIDEVRGMMAEHVGAPASGVGHRWFTDLDDLDGRPVGVAYVAPERMAEGTWNLYLIAVHPGRQGQGLGSAIVRHVEREVARLGGRILLVETSGTADFERVRAFYRARGFDLEARIRDFYKAGDDKVIYRKPLAGPEG